MNAPANYGSRQRVLATGGQVSRSHSDRAGDRANVMEFGTDSSDFEARLTAAISYLRTKFAASPVSGSIAVAPFWLVLPNGSYTISTSIDLTAIVRSGWGIDGKGAVLTGAMTGKPFIDLTGSRWGSFKNLTLYGHASNVPLSGIQQARLSTLANADHHHMDFVFMDGYFTNACIQNNGAEVGVSRGLWLRNRQAAGYALILDVNNSIAPVSDYQTVGAGTSLLLSKFVSSEFYAYESAGQSPIYIGGAKQTSFDRCYAVTNAGAIVTLEAVATAVHLLDLDLHAEKSGGDATSYLKFIGTGAATVKGLRINSNSFQGSTQLIETAACGDRERIEPDGCGISREPPLGGATPILFSRGEVAEYDGPRDRAVAPRRGHECQAHIGAGGGCQ